VATVSARQQFVGGFVWFSAWLLQPVFSFFFFPGVVRREGDLVQTRPIAMTNQFAAVGGRPCLHGQSEEKWG